MRTAFDILKRDVLALVKNPIALLVVGALLVLPGLYAWYCILANWDPYANTGNMPIAVVNYDKGADSSLTGEVNVGQQVTEQLEDNDSIDWRFYDSEAEALEDTRFAVVYATIVLPEDLSENIVGIFEGSTNRPSIYYYPNEKYNAVATKVTDSAAQTLVRQINQNFSSTVNKTVLASAQKVTDKVEERADETNKSALAEMRSIQDDLQHVVASLDDALGSIEGWRTAVEGAKASLNATSEQLPAIRSALENGSGQLDSLSAKTSDFESELSSTILDSASSVAQMSAQAGATVSQASQDLKAIEERAKALKEVAGADYDLKSAAESLEAISAFTGSIVDSAKERVDEMDGRVQNTTDSVSSATKQISNDVMPQLDSGVRNLSTSFAKLSGALGQFEPQIVQLQAVLSQTDSALVTATDAITDAKALLSTISDNLQGTVTDIGAIGNALQIEEISELLDTDPENVGTFISSPVQMVTEKIYPVSNYGTAVAPFYTNLALWIGCFILVSLMKVEVAGFKGANSRQRYFGRWLLFVILALLQSQVICGVDILLGIDCDNPALFMLAGAACSFAYMNVIFALVKTFRNIGKTLCVLLLIVQVPGSSGMYPIQMMPGFFQFVHPTLPFTYGINAMREALCGIHGLSYLGDLLVMLFIVLVSLALGLMLRPLMANLLVLFDEEMNKAGFFASEEHGKGLDNDRVRGMVRTLAAHESYSDSIEERAWRFNRLYPRMRKMGTIATFVIPFGFLLVIFPFNLALGLSVDVKLTSLVIVIVLLLVVLFGLIFLEYMQRVIAEETRLLGASLLGDDWDFEGLEIAGDSSPAPDTVDDEASVPKGGPTRDIFATDMRLGFQSVVGVVVIMLLVITPSMYAWFNIAGSWDPYSNTGNLKVAVANDDAGYKGELIPVTITVGDTIVSQLRGNESFDWVFVDADEAVAGVEDSRYYAAIVIPSDFSSSMMTYLIDDANYPNVYYYTNEKENPIAPIITQKGADSIQENIRVSFTERVDEVALSVAYDILNYVSSPRMTDYASKMGGHLDDATSDAKGAARELRTLSGLSATASDVVDGTGTALDGLKAAGVSARVAVDDAKAGLANSSEAFEHATGIVKEMLGNRDVDVEELQALLDSALELLEVGAETTPDLIQDSIDEFERLKSRSSDPAVISKCDALISSLQEAKRNAAAVPGRVADARSKTDTLVSDTRSELEEVKAYFNGTVKPSIDELRTELGSAAASTTQIVDGLGGTVEGLGDSTGGLSNQLSTLSSGLEDASVKLETTAESIEDTKSRLAEALKSGDVKQIEAIILGGDPEMLAAELASPLTTERQPVYTVSNYGSAMAPFYTVLSLWVGALVMISTMRVHVVEERIEELRQRYGKVRARHEFFGRYGIFGFIGLLQSSLVLLGDLLFLHIQCENPVLFFLFGIFIGQIFCLVVYTITELFGDVGKALCVILLIMQVAASGGTFPVEMLDPLLTSIVAFLPFYHAMSLLQECVAGINWSAVAMFVLALSAMAGGVLIMGLPLRRPFRKLNDFFEEQLEKTGYM